MATPDPSSTRQVPTKCAKCGGSMSWPQRVLDAAIPSLTLCPTCFANQPEEPPEWEER